MQQHDLKKASVGTSASLDALDDGELSLEPILRFVGVVRRRWWLPTFLAVAATGVAIANVASKPIVYRATSTLLLESRQPRVVDKVAAVTDDLNDPDRFANSQVHILTSERMAEQVERRMHLSPGTLGAAINVAVDRNSQLMTLSVDDLDPEKARKVVNAYTDAYVESAKSEQASVASDAATLLRGESTEHRDRLEQDERALYDFQRDNGLPASNFEESHKIYASTLQTLHQQASAAFAAGVKLRAELEQVKAAKDDRELRRRLAFTSGTDSWNNLHSHYLGLVEQAAQLEARYGSKHPKLVETQEAIASVGKALDREVDASEAALAAHVRSNASEQAQLKTAIAAETTKAVDLRQKELEYNRLKRHLDEDRESYDLVAKRQKELEIQAAIKQGYVKRLDAATAAVAQPRPIGRAGMLGALFGLFLGVGLVFLLDMLDDTVRTPQEAEAKMRAPLLGFVSELATAAAGDPGPEGDRARAEYIVTYPRSVVAEQCHTVSTTVFSLFLEAPPKSLAIVSAASHDGKTLSCVNLAAALSARGKRVLLIDTDLRRGRLHSLFKVPQGDGVFELATGHIELDKAIRRTFIPNVDFMSCGNVPDKVAPSRILELDRLRTHVAALRERYDLLLFDTAPVPMVSDVLMMADLVDGAIGIFRAGQTSTRLSSLTERQLAAARVNFLGWVLNGVSERDLRSRYYRKYGYGYAYAGYERVREDSPQG